MYVFEDLICDGYFRKNFVNLKPVAIDDQEGHDSAARREPVKACRTDRAMLARLHFTSRACGPHVATGGIGAPRAVARRPPARRRLGREPPCLGTTTFRDTA